MQFTFYAAGLLVLIVGLFVGFASGSVTIILLSLIGGLILLGISKVIEVLEEISRKFLEIPYTKSQLWKVIKQATEYEVESSTFDIHPNPRGDMQYPLVMIDNEYYIRARVFYKYLSQSDNEYLFQLPGQEPVTIRKSPTYYNGVALFDYEEQVFVMLRQMKLDWHIEGNKLILA